MGWNLLLRASISELARTLVVTLGQKQWLEGGRDSPKAAECELWSWTENSGFPRPGQGPCSEISVQDSPNAPEVSCLRPGRRGARLPGCSLQSLPRSKAWPGLGAACDLLPPFTPGGSICSAPRGRVGEKIPRASGRRP